MPWELGEKNIQNTTSYKYLGDMITSDNKNKLLTKTRENNLLISTRQINTTASSDVMSTKVILELYEKKILTSFLNNAESWTLTNTEEKDIDRIGIQALKRLFNLSITTPSAAIIFSFGVLYFTEVVDQKRFMFLHKILTRLEEKWLPLMLNELKTRNLGWPKKTDKKLTEYGLTKNWQEIQQKTKKQWKDEVQKAIDEHHRLKLKESCVNLTRSNENVNTKTKYIYDQIKDKYERKVLPELLYQSKHTSRTIILARHKMLECGTNFKGITGCFTSNYTKENIAIQLRNLVDQF